MKAFRAVIAFGLLAALAVGILYARGAMQVVVGYSAKQMCSGVFVAGLPEDFLLETDILPRMAILGPLLGALKVEASRVDGSASASLLGVSARAVHLPDTGCTLHASGTGATPLVTLVLEDAGPGVPGALRAVMDQAFGEAVPNDGARRTLALLVSQNGKLLAERYAAPITAGTRLQGWSMNKSLMSTWIGMQAARGRIDPELPLVEALEDQPESERLDPRLTLLHLLQMESGLDFAEVYGPGGDATRMFYTAPAMWKVPASSPQAFAPGEHFYYSSGDTTFASYVWQRSLERPYAQWISEQFSQPLGIRSLVAEADASGVQVGSSYAYLTARDWLAVGQLWLDAWHGGSSLLPKAWLRDSVTPRSSDAGGRYGRGFWLNTDGVKFAGLPDTLFYAGGNAGQYVVVIPEWEMVVVRLGLSDPDSDTGMQDFLTALDALRAQGALAMLPARHTPKVATAGQNNEQ